MQYLLLFILFILLQGCNKESKQLIMLKHGGIGSGAFYHKNDPKNIIYTIKEKPATIYKLDVSYDSYKVVKTIKIKRAKNIDAEALVKLSDGSFWIADESYPSFIHIDNSGNILKRVSPKQLQNHRPNKGIESLAISPDEKYLYTILQAPTSKKRKTLFIYTYDIKKDKIIDRYKYTLDSKKNYINEIVCTKKNTLIMLENQKQDGYKFYKVNLKKTDKKKEVFHFDRVKKIEGVAYLKNKNWILINDDDSQKDWIKGALIRVSF